MRVVVVYDSFEIVRGALLRKNGGMQTGEEGKERGFGSSSQTRRKEESCIGRTGQGTRAPRGEAMITVR